MTRKKERRCKERERETERSEPRKKCRGQCRVGLHDPGKGKGYRNIQFQHPQRMSGKTGVPGEKTH